MVDALHISRIEIREAEAPEIRKYMNEKVRIPVPLRISDDVLIVAHGEASGQDGRGHLRLQGPLGRFDESKSVSDSKGRC